MTSGCIVTDGIFRYSGSSLSQSSRILRFCWFHGGSLARRLRLFIVSSMYCIESVQRLRGIARVSLVVTFRPSSLIAALMSARRMSFQRCALTGPRQCALDQQRGQLLDRDVFTDQVFGGNQQIAIRFYPCPWLAVKNAAPARCSSALAPACPGSRCKS